MISLKRDRDLKIMAQGGKILRRILRELKENVRPGIITKEIEDIAIELFKKEKVKPSFLNYRGFPAAICISVNDKIVHGVPKESIKIKDGDIVSIDVGIKYQGFHTDKAITIPVGKLATNHRKLIETTRRSLEEAIQLVKPNIHLSDISARIQEIIEGAGFEVVKECGGHGIGRSLHEDPTVLNFGRRGEGPLLKAGMTFAIEPMAVEGKAVAKIEPDGWTISTVDGSYAAHFEDTVAVTRSGHKVLT